MSALKITRENFQSEVMESSKPVLLDFWATWCGHCKGVGVAIEELAVEQSEVKIGKINIDEQGELAKQFRVMSIPTLILIKNGSVVNQSVGAKSKVQIQSMIRSI
ncbi:MAG: thioredoxin [Clostridiales bacterium]|nr:thioredoxin [Clostridiales bacterium]